MYGLELNKIIASILLSCVIIMLITTLTDSLYNPVLQPENRGYAVNNLENTENHSSNLQQQQNSKDIFSEEQIAELMKQADSDTGKKLFRTKCQTCHTNEAGGINKIGPNLHNIVGRDKAKHKGYNYSTAMIKEGGVWDTKSLFPFLAKPSKYIVGTKMSFAGFAKAQDIANLVKFLAENSEN